MSHVFSPTQHAIRAALAGSVIAASCTAAWAQQPASSRIVVSIDASARLSTSSVRQAVTFEQYAEQGSLTTDNTIPRRPAFGGGVAVRFWRQVGVAVGVDHLSASGHAQVIAVLPDPFTFNQPHTLTGSAPVSRAETAVHLNAAFWPYRSRRLDLLVEGGPSLIGVDQDFVSDVSYSQPPPYTSATFESATVVREHRHVVGGNVGGDLTWRLAPHVGVGGVLRFSRAHALFSDSGAPAVVVGGMHAGAGLRVSF